MKKLNRRMRVVVVFMFLFTTSIAFEGPNMKEGLWEITINNIEMPEMPMQMPPQTYTHCLTKKDMVPQKAQK